MSTRPPAVAARALTGWRSAPAGPQSRRCWGTRAAGPTQAMAQPQEEAAAAAAPPPLLLRPPVRRPPSPAVQPQQKRRMPAAAAPQQHRKIKLAVVGDMHTNWDADSEAALQWLGADLVVFVGDLGEESLGLIKRVAAIPHPKAVILGNHDAWFSLTPSGRKRFASAMARSSNLDYLAQQYSPGGSTPAIRQQLDALGESDVGYACRRFPQLGLSVIGGRPFSRGGTDWKIVADFYDEQYGISGFQDSAHRILDLALQAQPEDLKVVVAHNGPAGLGACRHSICGIDWTEPPADFGDPDLQEGLDMARSQGVRIPLVLFGHMHSKLSGSGQRDMVSVDPASGTVYLNTAVVPRIVPFPAPAPSSCAGSSGAAGESCADGSSSSGTGGGDSIYGHHFVVIEMEHGVVAAARDVWVGVQHTPAANSSNGGNGGTSRQFSVLQQQELVKTAFPTAAGGEKAAADGSGSGGSNSTRSGSYVCSIYCGHSGEWSPVVLQLPPGVAVEPELVAPS